MRVFPTLRNEPITYLLIFNDQVDKVGQPVRFETPVVFAQSFLQRCVARLRAQLLSGGITGNIIRWPPNFRQKWPSETKVSNLNCAERFRCAIWRIKVIVVVKLSAFNCALLELMFRCLRSSTRSRCDDIGTMLPYWIMFNWPIVCLTLLCFCRINERWRWRSYTNTTCWSPTTASAKLAAQTKTKRYLLILTLLNPAGSFSLYNLFLLIAYCLIDFCF